MRDVVVTIMICAYNHERYIRQTIDSVLNQRTSYGFVILITDDASSDNTQAIIKEYIDKNTNDFISVFNETNIGLNETLKKAIPYIKTKYICMLGGDDYWIDNDKLQKEIDYLELHPEVSLVHTGFRQWIENGNKWGEDTPPIWEWKMPEDRKKRIVSFLNYESSMYPCASTSCFRSEPFLRCYSDYPQLLDYGVGEGTLLHTSMCMYGGRYHYIPDLTTVYRVRENSLSHFSDMKQYVRFQLDYLRLRILVFQIFDIESKEYIHIVRRSLEIILMYAHKFNAIDIYRDAIQNIDIDKDLYDHYSSILSDKYKIFLYCWFLRIRNKVKIII